MGNAGVGDQASEFRLSSNEYSQKQLGILALLKEVLLF
jgi:hypothetical protein